MRKIAPYIFLFLVGIVGSWLVVKPLLGGTPNLVFFTYDELITARVQGGDVYLEEVISKSQGLVNFFGLTVSADKNFAAFSAMDQTRSHRSIYVVNLATHELTRPHVGPEWLMNPVFGPDGRLAGILQAWGDGQSNSEDLYTLVEVLSDGTLKPWGSVADSEATILWDDSGDIYAKPPELVQPFFDQSEDFTASLSILNVLRIATPTQTIEIPEVGDVKFLH